MMNINLATLGILFLAITLVGFYISYLYGRKTKKFRWNEYIAIIIWPFLFVIFLSYYISPKVLYFFIISSVVGFSLEYVLGFTYHKTLNKKLWEYDKFHVKDGYTSWLTIPLWGIGGVIFWFLSKVVGL